MAKLLSRIQYKQLKVCIESNKIVLITGPRKVGKSQLVSEILNEIGATSKSFDTSNKKTVKLFDEPKAAELNQLFENNSFIILEEAQYILSLQSIIEFVLSGEIKATLILCCSFQPLLDEVLREVLQLQGLEIALLPPSFYELAQQNGLPEEEKLLEQRLIYGNYPEVTGDLEQAEPKLREIIQEAIFTNLGVTDRINKSDQLMRMLQIIAFNIGEPISYNEIAEKSNLDNETVERYVDLLVKSFILIRIPTLFNGNRYELKKTHVIYFVDNGIRNVLISNFNPIFLRNDIDQLWRNWLISERIKWNGINNKTAEYKFWRTHTKQTMDFIEITASGTAGYKTSWEKKKKIKFPVSFTEAYPEISTHSLNRSTYWGFLTKK